MHSTTNIKDGIAEFAVFNSPPREVISIRADCADRVDGLLAQFIGAKIENKDEVIHVTREFSIYIYILLYIWICPVPATDIELTCLTYLH